VYTVMLKAAINSLILYVLAIHVFHN
jgi:hypothetical protein